eukprot:TRINITY_DN4996_c0_g1_i9.p1 TRINITY_DN4996_c0_g1~~TRINITY_DN4996_c0_g1_i9.p1  ORF type:complete len:705 (-),score=44.85 TRINITY_DN4996_c0_g1_i9:67-2181(-)
MKSIYAQSGYWVSQEFPPKLYQCNPREICVGGLEDICKEGYTGRLCSQCKQGYHMFVNRCWPCSPAGEIVFYVFFVAFFWWFLNSVLMRFVDTFGVILNWFQLLRVVGLFAVDWPPSIFFMLSLTAIFAFEVDVIELTCLFPSFSFIHNFVLQLLLPVGVGVFSGVAYMCSYIYYHCWYCKGHGQGQDEGMLFRFLSFFIVFPKNEQQLQCALNLSLSAFLSFLNGSFLALTKFCFDSFSCITIGDVSVMKNNHHVLSDSREYYTIRILGFVSLFVYIIPYPCYLIFASITLRRAKAFHKGKWLERLGWFYRKYEVEWHWYELTQIGHKIVFVAIYFFITSPSMQCICATLVTIALMLLMIYSRPYIDVVLDILQTCLQIALMLLLLSGLIFYNSLVHDRDRQLIEIFILVTIGLFALSFLFFLFQDLLEMFIHTYATWQIGKSAGLVSYEVSDVRQLLHVFELRFLLPWLFRSSESERADMFLLSQELADYVSNESDTSYLSTTKTGRWWRELSQRFPEVIDFLAVVDKQTKRHFMSFVEVLFNDFYHFKGEGNIHEMISWQDRAAVAQWLAVSSDTDRDLFTNVTLLVFKLVKGEDVARELKLRFAANGRELAEIRKYKRMSSDFQSLGIARYIKKSGSVVGSENNTNVDQTQVQEIEIVDGGEGEGGDGGGGTPRPLSPDTRNLLNLSSEHSNSILRSEFF